MREAKYNRHDGEDAQYEVMASMTAPVMRM